MQPIPAEISRRRRASFARWDAIVVGSGVGGSVVAALLAHAGRRVLVLEKNPYPGGVLGSYRRDGFKIDAGSHLVARGARGPLGQVLRQLGLDGPRFLTHPIPVRSRGMFEATAPPSRAGLPAVAAQAARDLGLGTFERLRMARLVFQMLTLTEPELRVWDRRTLDRFIRSHSDHPGTYFLFSFLASIFFVLPPWRVSAGEAIRCLRRLLLDYSLSYIEGGMDAYVGALLGEVVRRGGQVLTRTRVTRIRRRLGGLSVVTAEGDEHWASKVACDLAPVDLLALLDARKLPQPWISRVRGIQPSGSAHQVKLALSRPLLAEGCLIGGVSLSGLGLEDLSLELMQRAVASIEVGAVSDPLAIYAPVPSNYDPTLAPPGCQLVVASIYGPVCPSPVDPPARWRERSLEALARVIPGLDDALLWSDFIPIPALGRWMGKSSNAAICNGQTPGQVGRDRLPVATPVPGLYLCGDGAGGRGIGMELAATSAMQAAERMLAATHHREVATSLLVCEPV